MLYFPSNKSFDVGKTKNDSSKYISNEVTSVQNHTGHAYIIETFNYLNSNSF